MNQTLPNELSDRQRRILSCILLLGIENNITFFQAQFMCPPLEKAKPEEIRAMSEQQKAELREQIQDALAKRQERIQTALRSK